MKHAHTWINLGCAGGLAVLLLCVTPCYADTISLTGSLDPNNPNDVLLESFVLSSPSFLTIQSYGYGGSGDAPGGTNAAGSVIAPGGFDTYLSLFGGIGPAAMFVDSNDDGLCPPGSAAPACHDSTLVIAALPAGAYTIALTVFDNFSFAENFGGGTLGDGFIGLGDYFDAASGSTRTSNYALDISAPGLTAPVPEPAGVWQVASGVMAIGLVSWRRKREVARRTV